MNKEIKGIKIFTEDFKNIHVTTVKIINDNGEKKSVSLKALISLSNLLCLIKIVLSAAAKL